MRVIGDLACIICRYLDIQHILGTILPSILSYFRCLRRLTADGPSGRSAAFSLKSSFSTS